MTEAIATLDGERHPLHWTCAVPECDAAIDGRKGGRWCSAHRRALRLTAALTDVLAEFLADAPYDRNIVEAGEMFAIGLNLLLKSRLNEELVYEPTPLDHVKIENQYRWKVSFVWGSIDAANDP